MHPDKKAFEDVAPLFVPALREVHGLIGQIIDNLNSETMSKEDICKSVIRNANRAQQVLEDPLARKNPKDFL